MSVEEEYHIKHTAHLVKLHATWKAADRGSLSWYESDEQEKDLDKRFQASLMVWFGRLSYDEQIQLGLYSGNEKLIGRLDGAQRAALVIMS